MQMPIRANGTMAAASRRNPGLDVFFKPRSVAVIGATEKSGHVGRAILWNLISSPFGWTVYPVNSKRAAVLGIRAYPSIAAVPEHVDLVVVVTPADSVPRVIRECADVGVDGAVIISAGFRETGPQGLELEASLAQPRFRTASRILATGYRSQANLARRWMEQLLHSESRQGL
jgi:acetyltransferase